MMVSHFRELDRGCFPDGLYLSIPDDLYLSTPDDLYLSTPECHLLAMVCLNLVRDAVVLILLVIVALITASFPSVTTDEHFSLTP